MCRRGCLCGWCSLARQLPPALSSRHGRGWVANRHVAGMNVHVITHPFPSRHVPRSACVLQLPLRQLLRLPCLCHGRQVAGAAASPAMNVLPHARATCQTRMCPCWRPHASAGCRGVARGNLYREGAETTVDSPNSPIPPPTQAAKTYLERTFEGFLDATTDELVHHALLALRATLQVGDCSWDRRTGARPPACSASARNALRRPPTVPGPDLCRRTGT